MYIEGLEERTITRRFYFMYFNRNVTSTRNIKILIKTINMRSSLTQSQN